jgi:GT2 family glycosyltransferase/tetratricopeptide (TPR) repeat protein/2-polyprenyl-3-methyl-5-hydroxy-6-metoxy-1,4-benzoquinol methylase
MAIQRVALIYNDEPRPETTGSYCLRALRQFLQVEHFRPRQLAELPKTGFDLYLRIDDGQNYPLPEGLHPSVYWAIDTHMDFAGELQRACQFDLVFAAQRDGSQELKNQGIASATWLPLACDPEIHRPHTVPCAYDIAFVGTLVSGPRTELLRLLQERYPSMFVGQRYFEEMAKIYSAAKLVFNRSVCNDVNMRVFEALGCGALLLTNDLRDNGQDEFFRDGIHLATYRDAEELLDKARYYLAHDALRNQIAAAGKSEAHAKHTYRLRMEEILKAVEEATTSRTALSLAQMSAPTTDAREQLYFDFHRPEVLALVPPAAARILDIGCAAGRLGMLIKERQQAQVTGIEYSAEAAAIAQTRLDRVVVGDIETLAPDFDPQSFDAVVCADVLEHLREPGAVLKRIRSWLRPDGKLIVSIPNVRHHSVICGLLAGNWSYQPAGLLDRDHLRFFTRREIEKLLHRSGFTVTDLQIVPGASYEAWDKAGQPGAVTIGGLHINGLTAQEAQEFHAYQYLLVAAPTTMPDYGTTSIVIVSCDRLSLTRHCVTSIRQYTDEPYELIIVDNGSTDGSLEYLRSLSGVQVIANPTNVGFPKAANQGLARATGRQVLLLNNDTVVTTGWLTRLLHALHASPQYGIAGPCSNCANGPQRVQPGYTDLDELDGFAWDWGKQHAGELIVTEPLDGFCLLIRRELIETLGVLDERFGRGCCEDNDYCLRANRAGYQCVLARDCYIHHVGHATFEALGIDLGMQALTSQKLFREKWEGRTGPDAPQDHGLTSLVIVTRNGLDDTRRCVESIQARTPERHELIFVDNGSSDGTVEYLRTIPGAKLIENPQNLGFPKAANQGIAAATGEQILLLNNDTVVTSGWLTELLAILHRDPHIGLVGPMSNEVSGGQRIAVSYTDLDGLEPFARAWRDANTNIMVEADRLVGFCLLVRRKVFDAIGVFDERFGIGNFEDDDLTRRAREAGYRAVVAQGAFVHHVGGATFRREQLDFGKLLHENEALYRAKWDATRPPETNGHTPSLLPVHELEAPKGRGLKVRPTTCLLSLCMIVRNNARTLGAALEVIRHFVDEIIVVDTGSTDDTMKIARRYGARVYEFPWCDDFSAARNESLKYARGQWIFWMDSDDSITAEIAQTLRQLVLSTTDPKIMAFVVKVHCPEAGPDGEIEYTVVDHVKLFRNRPDLRFDHRIHEQILPAISAVGGDVVMTDLYVTHSGYDHTPEGQAKKLDRDLRILNKELEERPNHPFTLFNLGMTYADVRNWQKAVGYLEQSLENCRPTSTHLRKVYALLVCCYTHLGDSGRAWEACEQGLRRFPLDLELRSRRASLLVDQERLAEAAHAFRDLLDRPDDVHFASVPRGLNEHMARRNLAAVYTRLGDLPAAEREWRKVTQETPRYREGWRGLGDLLVRSSRWEEASQLADKLVANERLGAEGRVIRANLMSKLGRQAEARQDFEQAAAQYPRDTWLQSRLCEFLFYHATPPELETGLQELLRRDPEDPSAYHNLGEALRRLGRLDDAEAALRRSLEIRPRYPLTMLHLGFVLKDLGRPADAVTVLSEALALVPDDQAVQQALKEAKALIA